VAAALGSPGARSVSAQIGVLQQTLMGEACARIAAGEISCALVLGGEARWRHLQAQIAGVAAPEREAPGTPDEVLAPAAELVLEVEAHSGLGYMPVGYYALLESAFRASMGWGVEEHRDRLGALYQRFSEIAAGNPQAWKREVVPAAQIRDAAPKNRMLAFPYTKLHNTSWNVDQAAALLFCSAGRAQALGIPRERWVFPLASTESNHMQPVAEREVLHGCPGARIAGQQALASAGLAIADVDLLELYSCFPVAVEIYAAELGIDPARDLTVTGGMPFAGGPLNNYVLQATARMAELLRAGAGRTGLVSSVSGYLTKQGFGLWSTRVPVRPHAFVDVTDQVAAVAPARPVRAPEDAPVRILATTVMYHEDRRLCGVALAEYADGARTVVSTADEAAMERLEREPFCGAAASIAGGRLVLAGCGR
jgi:acetyl-CoA C-acetyltransferase